MALPLGSRPWIYHLLDQGYSIPDQGVLHNPVTLLLAYMKDVSLDICIY